MELPNRAQPIPLADEDDDWVLLDEELSELGAQPEQASRAFDCVGAGAGCSLFPQDGRGQQQVAAASQGQSYQGQKQSGVPRAPSEGLGAMAALSEPDVELIRASWVPARKDPVGAGVLLFKG